MSYFKQYSKEENVFKNSQYLNPSCLPREFHYRDNEMATIASYIQPIFDGTIPIHAVIIGGNATGKTTAIQKLFEEIEEVLTEAIPVYINCRKNRTKYSIYSIIYEQVTGKQAPTRGSNNQHLLETIMKTLQTTHKALIIALDDANYLLGNENTASPHSQNVIRNFTRANESYDVIIGIYPIITSHEFCYHFESEVSTLFTPLEVYFNPYTSNQYFYIIKERCQCAFNIKIEDNVIKQIVEKIEETQNIRLAWDILKQFGIHLNNNPRKSQKEAINDILKQRRYI